MPSVARAEHLRGVRQGLFGDGDAAQHAGNLGDLLVAAQLADLAQHAAPAGLFGDDEVVLQFYDDDLDEIIIPTVEFIPGFARVWMPDDTHQLNVTIIG